jgi:hypothetical protein
VLLAGCDRENRRFTRFDLIGPTAPVRASIVPPSVALNPLAGSRCPFTSAFDLLIDHQGRSPLVIEQVTIRLLDGSSVGGSPVLMSSADLAARFGSTQLHPGVSRRFRLQPRFGCEPFVPRSLGAVLVLSDGSGGRQTLNVVASIG